MICVSFSKPTVEQFLLQHPEVKMIELRLDLMEIDEAQLSRFLSLPIDTIATCRLNGQITEKQRFSLLCQCISLGTRYVDIEIESGTAFISVLREWAAKHNCRLIVSYHNFEKTPDLSELEEIAEKCHAEQADIVKIACMINEEQDILNLKSLYTKNYPIIALGMGEKGTITRIKACEWGAPFTFAAACSDATTAAGQVDYETFKLMTDCSDRLACNSKISCTFPL
jgi:3-dehydroquinate dehydratase-1